MTTPYLACSSVFILTTISVSRVPSHRILFVSNMITFVAQFCSDRQNSIEFASKTTYFDGFAVDYKIMLSSFDVIVSKLIMIRNKCISFCYE